MILPTTLFIGVLGYLFYSSKKELLQDNHDLIGKQEDNNDLYEDLEDLFI